MASRRVRRASVAMLVTALGSASGLSPALGAPGPRPEVEAPTTPSASPLQVQFRYELGEGAGDCPTRDALRGAVSTRLGYDPFVASSTAQASVSITARGARYTALVRLTGVGQAGERRVEATVNGCDEIIDALALAVSLALDPEAVERVKRPRRTRELAWSHRPRWGLAEGGASRLTDLTETAAAPARRDAAWRMATRVGISLGGTPSPAPDLRLALERAWGELGAGVELRGEVPVPRSTSGGSISAHLVGATATGCFGGPWIRGCALVTAGALVLHSGEVEHARSRAVAYGSAGGRVALSWPVDGGLSVDIVADLEVAMVRAGIRLGDGIVWRAERVLSSASVGLGWRL